jgi:hypothetical protein
MLISLSSQQKDQDITLTLSITELEAISKVANSNFYSDKNSWQAISIEYLSPENNQKKIVPMDYNGETVSIEEVIVFSSFFTASSATLNRIVIYDKGNGFLTLNRSDIPNASQLDINF